MRAAPLAVAVLAVLAHTSCNLFEWAEDRARDCDVVQIDISNRSLVAEPVNIAMEDEPYANANLLLAGQTRRVTECVEEGDRVRFRAGRGGITLDDANCVVSREDYELEYEIARVTWDVEELYCENW
jgi:hypothetical protein